MPQIRDTSCQFWSNRPNKSGYSLKAKGTYSGERATEAAEFIAKGVTQTLKKGRRSKPVSLAQLKLATQDKIVQGLTSELQASSLFSERLAFDDCVFAAGGSGLICSTVTTGSVRLLRPLSAP